MNYEKEYKESLQSIVEAMYKGLKANGHFCMTSGLLNAIDKADRMLIKNNKLTVNQHIRREFKEYVQGGGPLSFSEFKKIHLSFS